jgi:hypothetical protein
MATKTSAAKTAKPEAQTTPPAAPEVAPEVDEAVSVAPSAAPAPAPEIPAAAAAPKRRALSSFDQNELVDLKSCVYGTLFYKSRAGYTAEWPEFGTIAPIPFHELVTMRNEQPAFFKNVWVIPVSDNAREIIDALQLSRYYTDFDLLDDFDSIYTMSATEVRSLLSKATKAMRENIAYRAFALIQAGELDSASVIAVIEEFTGFPLREQS